MCYVHSEYICTSHVEHPKTVCSAYHKNSYWGQITIHLNNATKISHSGGGKIMKIRWGQRQMVQRGMRRDKNEGRTTGTQQCSGRGDNGTKITHSDGHEWKQDGDHRPQGTPFTHPAVGMALGEVVVGGHPANLACLALTSPVEASGCQGTWSQSGRGRSCDVAVVPAYLDSQVLPYPDRTGNRTC